MHLRADGGIVRLDVSDKGGDAPVPAVREVRSESVAGGGSWCSTESLMPGAR